MYNEMSNFPLWLLNAGLNLAFTVILYGVGPLFFYQTKTFPTTKKRVMAFSIIYTILAWLSFNLIRALWFGGGEIKLYPAVIWGAIFYNLLLKGLKKTGRLESPGSESGYWVPEPLKPTQKEPTEKTEKEKASSFYESEKASEQQSQKFRPLDPPQKFKKRSASSKKHPHILYIICALSILFGVSSGIFFLYKANDVELRYEKGWYDGVNAGKALAEEQYSIQEPTEEKNYIASVNSDKYHILSCKYAERISGDNRIYYETKAEAIEDGKSPCLVCQPDTKGRKITITQRP